MAFHKVFLCARFPPLFSENTITHPRETIVLNAFTPVKD